MDFSVIIATRNRPVLFGEALQSVLVQSHPSVELLVVDDGSNDENRHAYRSLLKDFDVRSRYVELRQTSRGHGQSYALNRGADLAQGQFLCFLDDDDVWTDPQHLSRAWAALTHPGREADVYFANQRAYLAGVLINQQIWLESVEKVLKDRNEPIVADAYAVSIEDLMSSAGFGHLNTSIIRRELFERIGGLDENIRYENDRDFYLRHIDQANGILYCPSFVSRHNAPDQTKSLNMSTTVSYLEKMAFRLYVWNKAHLFCKSPAIRRVAQEGKGFTRRSIAVKLLEDGRPRDALNFGLEALGTRFSFKWLAYCGYLFLRSAFGGKPR